MGASHSHHPLPLAMGDWGGGLIFMLAQAVHTGARVRMIQERQLLCEDDMREMK